MGSLRSVANVRRKLASQLRRETTGWGRQMGGQPAGEQGPGGGADVLRVRGAAVHRARAEHRCARRRRQRLQPRAHQPRRVSAPHLAMALPLHAPTPLCRRQPPCTQRAALAHALPYRSITRSVRIVLSTQPCTYPYARYIATASSHARPPDRLRPPVSSVHRSVTRSLSLSASYYGPRSKHGTSARENK